jgi:hypothetical protein
MNKYITSLKDLIAETSRNSFKLNESAKNGDPKACFQMGLVYLLGINTAIDFKKAKLQFSAQSLLSDPDAQRMLAFLSELEGDYSSAFMNYAKAAGSNGLESSYIEKVIQEREALYDWLNKWKLPTRVLNNAITTVLEDYTKGGDKKEKACIEIAAICQDTASCITAARILSNSGDYSDAMQWLQYGAVESNNPLYQKIESKLKEIYSSINLSEVLEVIEIEGNSLLSSIDIASAFAPARKDLNEIANSCSKLWRKEVMPKIETIKKKWENEEKERIRKEKEERRNALLQEEAEEELRKKRKKLIIKHSIIIILLFIFGASDYKELEVSNGFIGGVVMVLSCYFWYYFIRWIWRGIKNRKK